MASRTSYRVIQWATGKVGRTAIRHFLSNPTYQLVGVWVTNPKKVGRDAGELASVPATGIVATNDVEALLALDADCVHYSPLVQDLAMVCRLLRSGKNVVSTLGPFYRTERYRADLEQIEAACRDGGTSFHGSGVHPGFVGDLLPLTLARLMSRVDRIHITEVIDHLANPSKYIEYMGFGRAPEDVRANPGRPADAPYIFSQSMAMLVDGLGKKIEDISAQLHLCTATRDIPYRTGVIRAGTVAGQHYEWSAWAGDAPLVTYHCFWKMGDHDVEPKLDCGESGYRIVIEGDPPTELTLRGTTDVRGQRLFLAIPWTAMVGVNAIPDVCDAAPGVITHFDLGVIRPRGSVRSRILNEHHR